MSISTLFRRAAPVVVVLTCVSAACGQAASVQTVGSGWGVSSQPELNCTRPVIGQDMITVAHNCIPNATAWFGISAPPASSTHVGNGLHIQIDLHDFVLVGPVTTNANGYVSITTPVNFPPQAAGDQYLVQMHVTDPATALCVSPQGTSCTVYGFEVTNGLLLTLGNY